MDVEAVDAGHLARIVAQEGAIVECKLPIAYLGDSDSASHAFKGPTPRNAVMFGPPARAYVYLIYGMHHMLNIVTEAPGRPCAVLIRSVVPLEGVRLMQQQRGGRRSRLTDGPGKLCQALAIDRNCESRDAHVR